MSLHSTILNLHRSRGHRVAYSLQLEGGKYRRVSSADYVERTVKISARLAALGVKKGDRVFLFSENGPEWTMAVMAILNLGATVVPIAAVSSFMEAEALFSAAVPSFTFFSRRVSVATNFEALLIAEEQPYFCWDLQEPQPLAQFLDIADVGEINTGINEHDIAVLIYTSGTTGAPKAVPISHHNLLSNAQAALKSLDARANDRLVSVLPLSHLFEFTGGFVTPTLVGATVTYVKSLKSEDLINALKHERATILVAVPLLFEILARSLESKLSNLPFFAKFLVRHMRSLVSAMPWLGKTLFFPIHAKLGGHIRFFMAGGSRLHASTFESFRSLGLVVLQGYGLTETSPVLTVTSLSNASAEHVGLPLEGVSVGIFNAEGIALGQGCEGEIWAKGPSVFKGYLSPKDNEGAFSGEWFKTGDLGKTLPNGCLQITGRKKDVIVTSGGKNVYPEEIESYLLASGKFMEVSVLGTLDASENEKVTVVVVPERSKFVASSSKENLSKAAKDEVVHLCRSLAEYKQPQRVEVWFEELPKTSTKKVKKHELRNMLSTKVEKKHSEADKKKLDPTDPLEAAIAEGILSITKISDLSLESSLTKDLGLDSLTFVELVSHVEKRFSVQIDGVDFSSIQTVEDLAKALKFAAPAVSVKAVAFSSFDPLEKKALFSVPRLVFQILLRVYLIVRHSYVVEGRENLPKGVPILFTPNHTSHFDLLSIVAALPLAEVNKTFAVAAKDYFFRCAWQSLLSRLLVNAVPFDRKGRVNQSMQMCRTLLDNNQSLVIFPEGTRSPSGKLGEFKVGVSQILAGHPNAVAIPVYIDGAYKIMPKGSRFPKVGPLRVVFGKPVSFRHMGSDSDSLKQIANQLRVAVEKLS